MKELKASKSMTVAFGRAAQVNQLDRVTWLDDEGTTFTANLKTITIDPIDTTEATLVYELYTETELTDEFEVHARVDLTVWYDNLSNLNIHRISPLNKGLTEGTIKKHTEGYYSMNNNILGLLGEEVAIETYLKGIQE